MLKSVVKIGCFPSNLICVKLSDTISLAFLTFVSPRLVAQHAEKMSFAVPIIMIAALRGPICITGLREPNLLSKEAKLGHTILVFVYPPVACQPHVHMCTSTILHVGHVE